MSRRFESPKLFRDIPVAQFASVTFVAVCGRHSHSSWLFHLTVYQQLAVVHFLQQLPFSGILCQMMFSLLHLCQLFGVSSRHFYFRSHFLTLFFKFLYCVFVDFVIA